LAAYRASEWSDLFVATAGASAALAGLVFVAVSINLERILGYPGLPDRAAATLSLLVSVLVVSVIGLVPGQSGVALGAELLGEGLVVGAMIFHFNRRGLVGGGFSRRARVVRHVPIALGTVPLVIGGASVLAGAGGGLYWTAAGVLGAIAAGVLNAWILLVEILR
jgi:hypothetical protein